MKRSHKDLSKTKTEWKKAVNNKNTKNDIGRYRKIHALGCNKTRCGMCKSHKVPKRIKTYKEFLSDLDFEEGIDEIENLY